MRNRSFCRKDQKDTLQKTDPDPQVCFIFMLDLLSLDGCETLHMSDDQIVLLQLDPFPLQSQWFSDPSPPPGLGASEAGPLCSICSSREGQSMSFPLNASTKEPW